jgi:flavin reductase (DIM6/NTAB) family NADH-FMN oxidoreductase RutF
MLIALVAYRTALAPIAIVVAVSVAPPLVVAALGRRSGRLHFSWRM